MQIAEWNGHVFEVSPGVIRSFVDLTLRGSAEVEDKVASNQKYAVRKAGNAREVSLTAILSAYLGCDVRSEAAAFVEEATQGESGYFYLGGQKLIAEQLMLIEASTTEVEIGPGGQWVYAKVQLTMRQSEKGDVATDEGTSSAGGKGSTGSKKTTQTSQNAQDKSKAQELASQAALKTVEWIKAKAKEASKKSNAIKTYGAKSEIQVIAMK